MVTERAPRTESRRGWIVVLFFVIGLSFLLYLLREDVDPLTRVEDEDIAAFERGVRARLSPAAVRPASALRVRAREVVWLDAAGRRLLASPALSFSARLAGAADIRIQDGVIERPTVDLVQDANGLWNYAAVLDPILEVRDGGTPGRAAAVSMRNVVVRNGTVEVRMPDTGFRATAVRLALSTAQLTGPGVPHPTFRFAAGSALLHLPDTADGAVVREVAVEDAVLRISDGALAFRIESGRFGSSTFAAAEGVWDPARPGLGLLATARVTEGRLADVPWLPGQVPEGSRGAFLLDVEPLEDGGTRFGITEAALTAPGSSVSGSARVALTAGGLRVEAVDARVDPLSLDLLEAFTGPLPYAGTVRGTVRGTGGDIAFEVAADLTTGPAADPFRTDLAGRIAFTDAGVEVRSLTADLDRVPLQALGAIAPGLPLAGPVTGRVTVDGVPGDAPLDVDLRLEAGGGLVTLAGMLDLRGPRPRYDLRGRVDGVELRRVLEPAAPPARVHASFEVAGTGLEPATAEARGALAGTFTGWESEAGDTLLLVATVDGGRLRADTAALELGPIRLAAAGDWRFVDGGGGAVAYDLEIETLRPLSPYLPAPDGAAPAALTFAEGRLEAAGTLSGTAAAPSLAGSLEVAGFRYGEWAAEALAGEYDVRVQPGLPRVEARLAAAMLRTPAGDFESATAVIDLTRPRFEVRVHGDQLAGGVIELEAGGVIDEVAGEREVEVRRLDIDLGEQRWALEGTAGISWLEGDSVTVSGFLLEQADGPGFVRLSGVLLPWDVADFELEIRDLPAREVLALVEVPADLTGAVDLHARLVGPADAPTAFVDLSLTEGSFRGVTISTVVGRFEYADARLQVDATAILGDEARVDIKGFAPARVILGTPPSFELDEDGPLALTLETAGFPLATLDPGLDLVTDLQGRLDADIRVAGSPGSPDLAGAIALREGSVTVPDLDRTWEDVRGTARLEGEVLLVDSLVARSDGRARATGRMVFETLTDPALALDVDLQGFRAQGITGDRGAAATGTLRLTGSLRTPRLTGNVTLADGTVSIAPFLDAPAISDAFVREADPLSSIRGDAFDFAEPGAGGPMVSNLVVTAVEDTWFATGEARAQLAGTLVVNMEGGDPTIQGDLTGDQGTFTLRVGPRVTRRFDIVAASIRFYGLPRPDPGLDITASRLVRTAEGRDVDIRINVGGTLENPTLSLASAEGASLPESELFCFIAIGRPCTELTALGANPLLDVAAIYGVSDIVAERLGVPLDADYFEVQMRPTADLSQAFYVVIGEEFDRPVENLFLLLELPIGGQAGELYAVSMEWRVTRKWTLEAAWEPTSLIRNVTTGRTLPENLLERDRQFLWTIRRRWTY